MVSPLAKRKRKVESGPSFYHGLQVVSLGLLIEVVDAALAVDLHQAVVRCTAVVHRDAGDGDVSSGVFVLLEREGKSLVTFFTQTEFVRSFVSKG